MYNCVMELDISTQRTCTGTVCMTPFGGEVQEGHVDRFHGRVSSGQQLATVGILHLVAPTSFFAWIRALLSICRASAYI